VTRLKAKELNMHMQKVGEWVDWKITCDRFLAGDPEADVKGIAVSWMPTFQNLAKALSTNCNLFVTHEPLYACEADKNKLIGPEDAWVRKKKWLEKTMMIVYRCHDFWDAYPEIGIHGAWAKWLGFDNKPLIQGLDSRTGLLYYEVHNVENLSLKELADRILDRVKPLGQEVVHIVGDPTKNVRKIALGTGAGTDYRQMYNLNADVLLLTDDGTHLWESGQWALDMDIPLIIVNHSTSEEPGMITLSNYIHEAFPNIPVRHIPVGCIYRTIA
jgi:putative NIF3 family GTP cyclohydrolase 1 type 2